MRELFSYLSCLVCFCVVLFCSVLFLDDESTFLALAQGAARYPKACSFRGFHELYEIRA